MTDGVEKARTSWSDLGEIPELGVPAGFEPLGHQGTGKSWSHFKAIWPRSAGTDPGVRVRVNPNPNPGDMTGRSCSGTHQAVWTRIWFFSHSST